MLFFRSLNPEYTKFNVSHKRDSYEISILNDSFNLTSQEKSLADFLIKLSKELIFFDF